MNRKIEILSPAGSYESLKAAIAAGADAVYIGGSRFGARAYADNLQEEQLLEAIDYVHLHGRKIYLTINTLLKEQELKNELYDYLLPYYKQGIDAVIVQDIGVLRYLKEQFPDLPLHASTQMTITNVLGARMLEEQGVERVVTAREMQLQEIKRIAEETNLEIESFVHGALCYCYSGQCLYSSLIGGRSGNRGQCAQPCRLPYKVDNDKESQYVLSLKDICTLEYIPELVKAGIHSFKIEGRMKKPEYVALVTAMYRKYVDLYFEKGEKDFKVEPKDRQMLLDLYNRGGFHEGYYYTKNGREMLSLDRPNHAGVPALQVLEEKGRSITAKTLVDIHKGDVIELPDGKENFTFANGVRIGEKVSFLTHKKQVFSKGQVLNRTRNESLLTEIRTTIVEKKVKEKIDGRFMASVGEPAKLILQCGDICVEVAGEIAQEAINKPMSEQRIEEQLRKTGNTEFEFGSLEIEIEGQVFMPLQGLNELRRSALERLEREICLPYRRTEKTKLSYLRNPIARDKNQRFCVYVEELEQWEEALLSNLVARIYVDCNAIEQIWKSENIYEIIQRTHACGKEIYLAMPHIFRQDAIQRYESEYVKLFGADWDGVLIRNYESYQFLIEHGFEKSIVPDYNLYQFNQYAKAFWDKENVESLTAPLELNYNELADLGMENSELVVYGYLPMMISAGCIQKTTKGCNHRKGILTLTDRYRKKSVVKNNCDYCYNIVYNTAPLVLIDQKKEIMELNPKAIRMHFTVEDRAETRKVIGLYEKVFSGEYTATEWETEFTRGHFKRGIK